MVDANDQDFTSWQDFFGPHLIHNDNYTSLMRYNFSDHWQRRTDVYGYGNDDAPQPQTFAAEDIVLLQDGACASTCTIFTEFMKTQAHVKQIAVGGRKQYGPMQGVGGIKGAQVQGMWPIAQMIDFAVLHGTTSQQSYFQDTYGTALQKAAYQALDRAALGGEFTVSATVNFRNNIRKDDDSETPLQFVYEAADCRFFYTAPMYSKQELVWDQTYSLAWGDGTCVTGSTGQVSSQFGDGYITSSAPAGAASNDTILPSNGLGKRAPSSSSPTPTGSGSSAKHSSGAAGRTLPAAAVCWVLLLASWLDYRTSSGACCTVLARQSSVHFALWYIKNETRCFVNSTLCLRAFLLAKRVSNTIQWP